MRGMASTRRNSRARGLGTGIGMANRACHATLGGRRNKLDCALQLRRNCHQANVAARCLPQTLEDFERGWNQVLRWMHSAPRVAEKRAFEMNAKRTSTARGRRFLD